MFETLDHTLIDR